MIYKSIKIYCGVGNDTVHKCIIMCEKTENNQTWDDDYQYKKGDGKYRIENGLFTIQDAEGNSVTHVPFAYIDKIMIDRMYSLQ